jgi:hypothetical protein
MSPPSYTERIQNTTVTGRCGCLAGFPKIIIRKWDGVYAQLEGPEYIQSRRNQIYVAVLTVLKQFRFITYVSCALDVFVWRL